MRLRTVGLVGLTVGILAMPMSMARAETAPDDVKFNDDGAVEASLTGKVGDPEAGKAAAIHRRKGNCLACHAMPIPEQQFHGEVGPDLSEVADRLTAADVRGRIVNPKHVNPDTIMPAFYRVSGLKGVPDKFKGKTMLSAQEVEDIVAYLMTLK